MPSDPLEDNKERVVSWDQVARKNLTICLRPGLAEAGFVS